MNTGSCKEWSTDLEEICQQILEYKSNLTLFKPECANTIAIHTIVNLKCDCSCEFFPLDAPPSSNLTKTEPRDRSLSFSEATSQTPKPQPRAAVAHGSSVDSLTDVKLVSSSEVSWAMHAITYGLTMPLEHWHVVRHSAHIYCYWLTSCLGRKSDAAATDSINNDFIPVAIRRDPLAYLRPLLYSLVFYFLPRSSDAISDRSGWLIKTAGMMASEPVPADIELAEPDNKDYSSSLDVPPAGLQPRTSPVSLLTAQLTTLYQIADLIEELCDAPNLSDEDWDSLLRFCLMVSHVSLAQPPPVPSWLSASTSEPSDSPSDALLVESTNERLVTLLMRVWIRACSQQHFPKPQLWLALRVCLVKSWRHQPAVASVWARVVVAFTDRLIEVVYDRPSRTATESAGLLLNDSTSNTSLISETLSIECIREAWFRFLFLLGNPVDLCHPSIIMSSPVFQRCNSSALSQARVKHSDVHLPYSYHQALRAVSCIVDSFLAIQPSLVIGLDALVGIPSQLYGPVGPYLNTSEAIDLTAVDPIVNPANVEKRRSRLVAGPKHTPTGGDTGPSHRPVITRSSVDMSVYLKDMTDRLETWLDPSSGGRRVTSLRPEVNSLLQLVGGWLFEAAVTGVPKDLNSDSYDVISSRASSAETLRFQVGRGEALGALLRIVIYSRRSQMAEQYLCRFYLCLHYALDLKQNSSRTDYILSTLLINAVDLLSVDLPGCYILLPRIFNACQRAFQSDFARPDYVSRPLLVRSAIYQLMSIVCVPFQFNSFVIKCLVPNAQNLSDPVSFNRIKLKLTTFIPMVLTKEDDPINYQLLLSTALALLESLASEDARVLAQPTSQSSNSTTRDDRASKFFGELVSLLCNHLLNRWSNHPTVTPYLLEILLGIANIHVSPSSPVTYYKVISQICEFIGKQCNRDPKDHRRQLHTIIVTAYICLSVWLSAQSNLVTGTDISNLCIRSVMETIGMGILGTRAKSGASESTRMAPSKRVSEAAESCLASLMSLYLPSSFDPCPQQSEFIEHHLLDQLFQSTPRPQFQYFYSEPGVVLGLLELSSSSNPSTMPGPNSDLPGLVLLLRGPFGRHAWIWRMRQSAKPDASSSSSEQQLNTCSPEVDLTGCYLEHLLNTRDELDSVKASIFPEYMEDIQYIDPDKSIGSLERVGGLPGARSREEVDVIKSYFSSQQQASSRKLARSVAEKRAVTAYPNTQVKLDPPSIVTLFQSIRKMLTHLGYALSSLDGGDKNPPSSGGSATSADQHPTLDAVSNSRDPKTSLHSLIPLQSGTELDSDLAELDRLPTRNGDTVIVFYAQAGQSPSCEDIVGNTQRWADFPPDFLGFLDGLGSLVSLESHSGWTGDASIAYRPTKDGYATQTRQQQPTPDASRIKQHIPDGEHYILYHADAVSELACICPTSVPTASTQQDSASKPTGDASGGRLAVVWLEDWDSSPLNSYDSPGGDLHKCLADQFNCPTIVYIHPLTTAKLYRIGIVHGQASSTSPPPIQNGLVLARHCLTSFVRQTTSNLARRRRLASDLYQPPHVRRSKMIGQLLQRHQSTAMHPSTTTSNNNLTVDAGTHVITKLFV